VDRIEMGRMEWTMMRTTALWVVWCCPPLQETWAMGQTLPSHQPEPACIIR